VARIVVEPISPHEAPEVEDSSSRSVGIERRDVKRLDLRSLIRVTDVAEDGIAPRTTTEIFITLRLS